MQAVKILLVDDDEDDFILTRDILNESPNRKSYSITWCNNYEEAINAMLKSHYDVYLVDYRLGKYTGIDLLHEAIRSNCTEPIIILTGKGDLKIDEEAMKIGAADYLVKDSIDGPGLERSIRYSLGQSRALKDLKASENKFRIIFERSKDPMIVSDFKGKLYDANPAALKYLEITLEDFLKSNSSSFYPTVEERNKFLIPMEEKGSVTDIEVQLLLPNGKTKYCTISSFLQISQHGTSELYHSILHDLTSRKQLEQESVITEKMAVSERIAKNFTKEIRNPLSNVNLALDEINASLNGHADSVKVYLDIVRENCEQIDKLTTQFIASTEPNQLDFKPLDASSFIKDVIEEAQSKFHIKIQYSTVPERLSFVNADSEKLKQVLMNVIENSAEALTSTDRNLAIDTSNQDGKLYIRIKDRGCGIEPENMTKVFEPFYTTKPYANGLGLTYSQRIIIAHGGVLTIESEPGFETLITIGIPLSPNLN